MIGDPFLWSLISIGWAVLLIAAISCLTIWALRQPDGQSELVRSLTKGRARPPRGATPATPLEAHLVS